MKTRLPWLTSLSGLRALVLLVTSLCCGGAAWADAVWNSPNSGSWLDAAKWSGPVPNAPGDIAQLQWLPAETFAITLGSSVTVGQVNLVGLSVFNLGGTGPLIFDNPTLETAALRVQGTPRMHQVNVPVDIVEGEQLEVDIVLAGQLVLGGGLAAGTGELRKTNAGTLDLTAGSPTWDGPLTVDGGNVLVRTNTSLGTPSGGTTVNAGGTVTLFNVGTLTEPFQLNGGTLTRSGLGGEPTLNGPIELLSTSSISTGGTFFLNGAISGAGGVNYSSSALSTIFVYGDNSYDGTTTIGPGRVSARHANALGSPNQGTIVNQNGELFIEVANSEPISVQSGTVQLASAVTATGTVTLEDGRLRLPTNGQFGSGVVLAGTVGQRTIVGRGATFTGGVTGTGNLYLEDAIVVQGQPLAHDGGLNVLGPYEATLNTANTFTGPTKVGNGTLVVNHPDALGLSTTPIEVNGGQLELNQMVQREIDLNEGSLHNFREDQPLERDIYIFRGGIRGDGVYNGQIHLEPSYSAPSLGGGTFNGVITGDSDVSFGFYDGAVTLNANNTYTGVTRVSGTVHANTPGALGSSSRGTVISSEAVLNINAVTEERILVTPNGRVNLNVQLASLPRLAEGLSPTPYDGLQTVAINVPSSYQQHYDVNDGIFEVNANTVIDSIEVRNGGRVVVGSAATLTVSGGEYDLQEGSIAGRIRGTTVLRKTTNNFAQLGNLVGYNGTIFIDQGILQVEAGSAFGTVGRSTRVASRDAVLEFRDAMSVNENIFLNNASGVDSTGGLLLTRIGNETPSFTLNGQLDLGTIGSIIGGGDQSSTFQRAILVTKGPITGGSLTTRGRWTWVEIQGNQNTYTGATEVREGTLSLAGNGRLTNTSAIVLYEDSESHDGLLTVDNIAVNLGDRIGDNIPFHMRGGKIYFSITSASTSETIGPMHFIEGESELERGPNNFSIGAFGRSIGATATFMLGGSTNLVLSPPALENGILPWLRVNQGGYGFGTVVGNVLQKATPTTSTINSATANDNVSVSGTTTVLNADKTVNSVLLSNSARLDLGGHRLSVQSGGVLAELGYTILNGELTATGANHELIFHSGRIEANIVDDGSNPVSVTAHGVRFTGNNTYSGTTYVNEGNLVLDNASALPDGADLNINGGIVDFDFATTALKHVGEIRIAGDGALQREGNGTFSFDELVLEDGQLLPGKLVGNAPAVKRTMGAATISADSNGSTYNGQIVVEEGLLTVTGLPQASYRAEGGTLVLLEGANAITLAGGSLEFFDLTGTIDVLETSRLISQPIDNAPDPSFAGVFEGSGNLVFDNRVGLGGERTTIDGHSPGYSGDVHIHTATVYVRFDDSLGTGNITVHSGGRLWLGAAVNFPNDINLAGGELAGARLAGDLYVSGNSRLNDLEINGAVHLSNGSRLTTTGDEETRLLGDILVSGTAHLDIGRTIESSWDLEANRGLLQVGGRIVSDAPVAVLKFDYIGIDDLVLNPSYHVHNGQSLEIRDRGLLREIVLADGAVISGGGTFRNPLRIDAGGVVSPGNSPGALTVTSLTFNHGSQTIIEIGGTARGSQYDAIIATSSVVLGGTLAVSLLDGFLPANGNQFDILDFANLTGTFSLLQLPMLSPGLRWDVSQLYTNGLLLVTTGLAGDFNNDNVVDAADYVIWRKSPGTTPGDLTLWHSQFGATSGSGSIASGTIPEPLTIGMLFVAILLIARWPRASGCRIGVPCICNSTTLAF